MASRRDGVSISRTWLGRVVVVLGWIVLAVAIGVDLLRGAQALTIGWKQGVLAFGGYALLLAGGGIGAGREKEAARDLACGSALAVQLFLLALVVAALQMESPIFYQRLVPLTFVGFLVHHALPAPRRRAGLAAISFLAVTVVFGLADGLWLILLGLVLIGVCHLPVHWLGRALLLLLLGLGYALLRTTSAAPWSAGIWPILGSMFMFRLIVYMRYLRHAKERPRAWQAVSYFFMLPNLVFPLFPVVDYKTFERTRYDKDEYVIYQRGVQWMLLGVVHLVAYRAVYHHFVLSPGEVTDVLTLGQYVSANFMQYLRVSGQFHFIVGMLHLFGFRLPATHRYFYLSESFTDLWRRINIYWKDFMMTTFYYPVAFAVRKRGLAAGVVIGTAVVFFLNWVLHAYQWFWILGSAPFSWTDAAFWGLLGLAVVANGLWELKRGRQRSLSGAEARSWGSVFARAARTITFFITLSLLWSMWTSDGFASWLALLDVDVRLPDVLRLAAILAGATVALAAAFKAGLDSREGEAPLVGGFSTRRAGIGVAWAAGLLVLATPATFAGANPRLQELAFTLRVNELNRADAAALTRGYYERLTGVDRFNPQLWDVYVGSSGVAPPPTRRETGDFRRYEVPPLLSELMPYGRITTNIDGMRDQRYERARAPNTFRVALLGPSYVYGIGVDDRETFETLAEARLAAEHAAGGDSIPRVEILNFGVPGHSAVQQIYLLSDKVLAFSPDVVIIAANQKDPGEIADYLAWAGTSGVHLPDEFLRGVIERAGIDDSLTEEEARVRLRPFAPEVLVWTYRRIADIARGSRTPVVWLHTPMAERIVPDRLALIAQAAEEAGLETYDMADILEGRDLDSLTYTARDRHMNPRGMELLASRFVDVIRGLRDSAAPSGRSDTAGRATSTTRTGPGSGS